MNTNYKNVRKKLTNLADKGFVRGLGKPEPGALCVEAAVCLALGEPHSDKPTCVHEADRGLAIRLNDSPWSSNTARAEAMLPLALAQLGTAGTDRKEWVDAVVEGTVRVIVPIALRAAASTKGNEKHAEALAAAAKRCEDEGTREAAVFAEETAHAAAAAADAVAAAAAAAVPAGGAASAAAAAAWAAQAAAAAADPAAPAAAAWGGAATATAAAAWAAQATAAPAAPAAARDEVLWAFVDVVLNAYEAFPHLTEGESP